MSIRIAFLCFLLAAGLSACAQRVQPKAPEGRVIDSTSY